MTKLCAKIKKKIVIDEKKNLLFLRLCAIIALLLKKKKKKKKKKNLASMRKVHLKKKHFSDLCSRQVISFSPPEVFIIHFFFIRSLHFLSFQRLKKKLFPRISDNWWSNPLLRTNDTRLQYLFQMIRQLTSASKILLGCSAWSRIALRSWIGVGVV